MSQATVADLLAALQSVAPAQLAEDWDRVGLMVGRLDSRVSGVLVALDATVEAVAAARQQGLNALVTHHPLLFRPLGVVDWSKPTGAAVAEAVKQEVSVLAAHTNLDSVQGGVSDVLADLLGLSQVEVLIPLAGQDRAGLGRTGNLDRPLSLAGFIELVKKVLKVDSVQVAGRPETEILRVAVCGGSGGDLVQAAWSSGAQVLLTGEVPHHAAREAEFLGLALIAAGHFATEAPVTPVLARRLEETLSAAGRPLKIKTHDAQQPPFETR